MCDAKIELLVTDALTFKQNNGDIRVFSPKIVNGEGLPFYTAPANGMKGCDLEGVVRLLVVHGPRRGGVEISLAALLISFS